jgi:hypothetical protein
MPKGNSRVGPQVRLIGRLLVALGALMLAVGLLSWFGVGPGLKAGPVPSGGAASVSIDRSEPTAPPPAGPPGAAVGGAELLGSQPPVSEPQARQQPLAADSGSGPSGGDV